MTSPLTRMLATAGAAALALALAACGTEALPEPDPQPAPATPTPVLTDDQLEEVLAAVSETLVAADAASAPDQLVGRLTGPAQTMREAEYALATITAGADTVTPLVTGAQVSIVGTSPEWPRLAQVVTTIPEGANLPLLLTLTQPDPRANYQLWSWVRLLPGIEMPATVNPSTGSAVVPSDSDALVASPAQTVEQYVDVLNNGDGSAHAVTFAEDAFRTRYAETFEALASGVSQAGSAAQSAAVNGSGTYALATNDGGAIVVGAIDHTLEVKRTVEGATLEVGTTLAYGGPGAVEGTLTAKYLITVAFHVPAAGSEELIRLLGVEQVLTGVTRDDSTSPD